MCSFASFRFDSDVSAVVAWSRVIVNLHDVLRTMVCICVWYFATILVHSFVSVLFGVVSLFEASFAIRRACTDYSIPCLTESDAAEAFVTALEKSKTGHFDVSHL